MLHQPSISAPHPSLAGVLFSRLQYHLSPFLQTQTGENDIFFYTWNLATKSFIYLLTVPGTRISWIIVSNYGIKGSTLYEETPASSYGGRGTLTLTFIIIDSRVQKLIRKVSYGSEMSSSCYLNKVTSYRSAPKVSICFYSVLREHPLPKPGSELSPSVHSPSITAIP